VKKPRISMMLTGGLGNQFFQLAALLYFTRNDICSLDAGIGRPRRNVSGKPEINTFELPSNVLLTERKAGSWLTSKSMGYILRMSSEPRKYEIALVRKLIQVMALSISCIYFQTNRKIIALSNLGYSPLELRSDVKYLLLGYFQTYRFAQTSEVCTKMLDMKIKCPSNELIELIALAKEVKPTIIHIRLGDYKNEDRFGIVPQEYYLEALTILESKERLSECWLFSDEPEVALTYFTECSDLKLRVISEVNNSAAETLELMRHGRNYVIGNSSYSWWAAFLSYSRDKNVVSPSPWFADIDEPSDLIPPNWIRLPITHL
jgi:hypothetical protein